MSLTTIMSLVQVRAPSLFFVFNMVSIYSFCFPLLSFLLADAAESWQVSFQDPATPIMQGIIDFHHDVFGFMLFILGFVLWILSRTLWHFTISESYRPDNEVVAKIVHNSFVEIV